MTGTLLANGHPPQQAIGFPGTDLHLQIPLFNARQAFIQPLGDAQGPATHCSGLAREFIEQIVGTATTGCHERQQVRAGYCHQAKAGIQGAADPLKGGEGPHHKDEFWGQAKRLAINQVVEVA